MTILKRALAVSGMMLLTAMAMTSCSDDDGNETTVVVLCECDGVDMSNIVVKGGSAITFNLKAMSNPGRVTRIALSYEQDGVNGVKQVADTVYASGTKTEVWRYAFAVPEFAQDNVTLRMRADAFNSEGGQHSTAWLVKVIGGSAKPLTEIASGAKIYAHETEVHANAFSLTTGRTMMTSLANQEEVDIYVVRPKAEEGQEASTSLSSYEWRSNTGVLFARTTNDAFNYSGATKRMLEQAWSIASCNPIIRNVKAGDIILVGNANGPIGVICVMQSYDEDGYEDDSYVINFKK